MTVTSMHFDRMARRCSNHRHHANPMPLFLTRCKEPGGIAFIRPMIYAIPRHSQTEGGGNLTPASKFWLPWLRGQHPRSQGRQSLGLLDSGGDNWYKTGGCGSSVCRALGNVVCA